jgi:predicted nucleotide-binding protein (sugar kinase/HSP70/actin superfamily)
VPPNPGTIGALGIALLTLKDLPAGDRVSVDLRTFLTAKVDKKETFVCNSTQGCGGAGNKCRIDRMATSVGDEKRKFTWGGGCSLYDKGTRRRKLPDLAPDPFRERREWIEQLVAKVSQPLGQRTVGLSDEFMLKGLFPFFATFIRELGFDLVVKTGADRKSLKRGIEEANIPFCAPMQLFHGLVSEMAAGAPDYLFLPMLRGLPRAKDEKYSTLCPIVQGSADMLRWDLAGTLRSTIVSPVIDVGYGNLGDDSVFREGCRKLAAELSAPIERLDRAYRTACAAQEAFGKHSLDLGKRALAFCAEQDLTPVVVLGREYTIHNEVLNSNVPAILREQGAIAIPVDCFPIEDEMPIFQAMFWGHGQRNLRAAHQIRRTPGLYSLFCSNYSCGPDSFSIHFYSYIMEGRPFAIIETDGHSGDAGTKTRVEAFLHCVHEDLKAGESPKEPNSFKNIELDREQLSDIRRRDEMVLIPRMGVAAEALAAAMRGQGFRAEALPRPDRESVRIGRRHTSGKECVPMTITMGSLLQRIEQDKDNDERFSFFMPTSTGPCRFGTYHLLHKIILERLGWKERVRVWSPSNENYFEGVPPGFASVVFTGVMAADLLLEMLYDARPSEIRKGSAEELYRRACDDLEKTLETAGKGDLTVPGALWEVASGRLFGVTELLERTASGMAALRVKKDMPTVLVVGEIYVRCDPFANDFVIDKLEQRGIRARFAPFTEWLEYTDFINRSDGNHDGIKDKLSSFVQRRIQNMMYATVAARMEWPRRTTVEDSLDAASPYLRKALEAESVLTLGGAAFEFREGHIDGVVSAGPLECMPNKISEAQFFHVAEKEGLLSITLALNGDPVDPEVIDNFAFEVHARFRKRDKVDHVAEAALLRQSKKMWTAMRKKAVERVPAISKLLPEFSKSKRPVDKPGRA